MAKYLVNHQNLMIDMARNIVGCLHLGRMIIFWGVTLVHNYSLRRGHFWGVLIVSGNREFSEL